MYTWLHLVGRRDGDRGGRGFLYHTADVIRREPYLWCESKIDPETLRDTSQVIWWVSGLSLTGIPLTQHLNTSEYDSPPSVADKISCWVVSRTRDPAVCSLVRWVASQSEPA